MLAILGALLEENDVDSRIHAHASEFSIPGEETDIEISRVAVYATIMELTSVRLLTKTSAVDRLDGPPTIRAAVGYEITVSLAREFDVSLVGGYVLASTEAVAGFLALPAIGFSGHVKGALYSCTHIFTILSAMPNNI